MTEPGDPALHDAARALAEGIIEALPAWVVASVERIHAAWAPPTPSEVTASARLAGEQAADDVGPKLRALVALDVDEQWTTPLALVRSAVSYPTAVLRSAGVPEVGRDAYDEAAFPEDPYGLTPASLADLDPALVEPGIVWGAAKAKAHRARHGG